MRTKRSPLDGYKTYDDSRGHGSAREWRAAFAETMGLDEARSHVGQDTPESILGIATGVAWSAVVSAYRACALACHPDRCASHGLPLATATERFKRLVAAFTILKSRYGR